MSQHIQHPSTGVNGGRSPAEQPQRRPQLLQLLPERDHVPAGWQFVRLLDALHTAAPLARLAVLQQHPQPSGPPPVQLRQQRPSCPLHPSTWGLVLRPVHHRAADHWCTRTIATVP